MDTNDTIIAIASPPGRSARGIIRLAGDAVPQVLNCVAQTDSTDNTQTDFESLERGVHHVRLQTGAGILPAVLLNYVAPHSYTGERAAELLLPGNPALLQRIVDVILDAARQCELPLRPAEPGEFSARAFFHGRLSLTQAEGVAATIAARSDAELRAAAMLRDDSIGRLASALCEQLARTLALVEAGVDFTDEQDVIAITADELRQQLEDIGGRITAQLERSVGSGMHDATPRVVLTGPPNAGKSTLFNVLLGRSRAVVSDVPGTTRDVLIEPLHITTAHGDLEVLLIDIAGAERATSSLISQHMQHVADDARQRADLLLRCIAYGSEPHEPLLPNELLVRTKCDLAPTLEQPPSNAVHISAATGAGLDELRRGIADRLAERVVSVSADAVALLPRHEAALREAGRLLDDALQLLERSTGRSVNDPELIAASMRIALDQLGLVAGRVTPDDVLGHIFAEFCIGK